MLQFLTPYWFIALAGLLVPVLIHWWNKKPPRKVRVGSIRWLQAAANQQSRQPALQNWPLLLLRCLLLTLLVALLAGPVWRTLLQSPVRNLVLVEPALLQRQTLPLVQSTLDSLQKQQYALHLFTPGFPRISPEEWDQIKGGEIKNYQTLKQQSYWQLARQLRHTFGQVHQQVIFTSNRLAGFSGRRPVLPVPTRWVLIPQHPEQTWVAEAFFTGTDSLRVIVGSSGTTFLKHTVTVPRKNQKVNLPGVPDFIFTRNGDQAYLTIAGNPQAVPVQAGTNIAVYYDKSREQDARYLKAALQALAAYTHVGLIVSFSPDTLVIKDTSNWLFWLSDARLPVEIQKKIKMGLRVFKDAPTAAKTNTATSIVFTGIPARPDLWKQIQLPAEPIINSWQNNYGEPVLIFQAEGQGGIYQFASRFHPQWGGLPLSGFFPEILAGLLSHTSPNLINKDIREISPEQAQPTWLRASTPKRNSLITGEVNLKDLFMLLAALLFLAERMWAYQKGKVT